MTILLALENGKLTDEITFSHDAVYNIEPGSAHIAILEGETLTLEQVLRAIILRSANEASNGVAEYVDGSVEAFAKHMTGRRSSAVQIQILSTLMDCLMKTITPPHMTWR